MSSYIAVILRLRGPSLQNIVNNVASAAGNKSRFESAEGMAGHGKFAEKLV